MNKLQIKKELKQAFEYGNFPAIAKVLNTIVKDELGLTQFIKQTGLTRMGVYKILKGKTDPAFSTLQKILKAFDLELTIK